MPWPSRCPELASGSSGQPKFTVLRSRAPGPASRQGWGGKESGQGEAGGPHPCPRASGLRVLGSQAERAPAPAFWVGEEKRPESRQFPPSAPRRGPSADWPAPGRKLGLYLQLITPRPTLPPPSWRQRTTGGACATPPLPSPLGIDTRWEGSLYDSKRLTKLNGYFILWRVLSWGSLATVGRAIATCI